MALPVLSPALALRLRRAQIVHPYWTWRQAAVEHLGLPLACAFLITETGGGAMIYGHDKDKLGPCPGYGWGTVTKTNYAQFKHLRQQSGRSNGVGGMQLTSPGLQDEADKLGGCWRIRFNYAVGFHYAVGLIREHGLLRGLVAYNGSGPQAEQYGKQLLALAEHLSAEGIPGPVGITG